MKTIDLTPEQDAKLKETLRTIETSSHFTPGQKWYGALYANYKAGRRDHAPPPERRLRTGKMEQIPEVEVINQTIDKLLGMTG